MCKQGATFNLSSSAPHIFPAAAWDTADGGSTSAFTRDSQARVVGLVLHRDPAEALELGVRRWHPGTSRETAFPMDEIRYFMKGHGVSRATNGEIVEVQPGTSVHFKQGLGGRSGSLRKARRNLHALQRGPR
jgi:uncharacterized cupin superfamily protein